MNLVVRVVRVIRVIRVSWGGKSDWAGEIRSRDHSFKRKRAIENSRPEVSRVYTHHQRKAPFLLFEKGLG
jgi:hypothetical protein